MVSRATEKAWLRFLADGALDSGRAVSAAFASAARTRARPAAGSNTALMINRMIRAFLAGTAARKLGITDPDYIAPERLKHK
jgi:hypothetical protein